MRHYLLSKKSKYAFNISNLTGLTACETMSELLKHVFGVTTPISEEDFNELPNIDGSIKLRYNRTVRDNNALPDGFNVSMYGITYFMRCKKGFLHLSALVTSDIPVSLKHLRTDFDKERHIASQKLIASKKMFGDSIQIKENKNV